MKLIGITGLAGAGKDTAASHLISHYDYKRIAFADPLKELCKLVYPYLANLVEEYGWDEVKKVPEFRQELQRIGNGARQIFGDNFWIEQAVKKFNGNTVVTDCRYPNEFDAVVNRGGFMVRVELPGLNPVNDHITETGHLDLPVKYTLLNDGSIDDLKIKIDQMMKIVEKSD